MKRSALCIALMLTTAMTAFAAIRETTVTGTINVSSATDYTISAETPFSGDGRVNLTNEAAALVLTNIKPSTTILNWLTYIYVNGEPARNGVNCQVKMYGKYGHGTLVLPYGNDCNPLTCYTGESFTGTSCNTYTTGSDGGYMKTLTTKQLNNKIQSFRLRRGYMVTFSTGTGGWGYSRCFIADEADLEMTSLPAVLKGRISSYRIFKWQDAAKNGVSGSSDATTTSATNSSWSFDWGTGSSQLPDVEIVPQKLHKDWPTNANIGKVEYSAHSKTDNEPANSADDNPATVSEVLAYWEDLMRTGLRLCSPSTYDGTNNASWFASFFQNIDANGWRCDIYDRHCYWTDFSQLATDYKTYGRPIWISELMWGSSWNNDGVFASGNNTQSAMYSNGKNILTKLNGWGYVERYAWWNKESTTASKLYANGELTTFGKYYAEVVTGLAYNKKYEYVPKVVVRKSYNLAVDYQKQKGTVKLSWSDKNGDIVDSFVVQRLASNGIAPQSIAQVAPRDYAGQVLSYSYTDKDCPEGEYAYRIATYSLGKTTPTYTDYIPVKTGTSSAYIDVTDLHIRNGGFDTPEDYASADVERSQYVDITGWNARYNTEWGAGAGFAVASAYTLNTATPPTTAYGGTKEGGVLALSCGWGGQNVYTQEVTLAAGKYRLAYAVYNSGENTSFTNLTGVVTDSKSYYGNLTSVGTGEWRSESITFSLSEEQRVSLQVGFQAANAISTDNAILCYDYIRLEQMRDDAEDYTDRIQNPDFNVDVDYTHENISKGTHNEVTGWTTDNTSTLGASGCFAAGVEYTFNEGSVAPDGSYGLLCISQGWNIQSVYTQEVELPAGDYLFSYKVYNTSGTISVTNRTGVIVNGTGRFGSVTSFPVGTWTTEDLLFTLDAPATVTLSVGYTAADNTSANNPFLSYDYVSLKRFPTPETDGIQQPEAQEHLDADKQRTDIYDLSGRRLAKPGRGIYIRNGKKYLPNE